MVIDLSNWICSFLVDRKYRLNRTEHFLYIRSRLNILSYSLSVSHCLRSFSRFFLFFFVFVSLLLGLVQQKTDRYVHAYIQSMQEKRWQGTIVSVVLVYTEAVAPCEWTGREREEEDGDEKKKEKKRKEKNRSIGLLLLLYTYTRTHTAYSDRSKAVE
jgi:hypothetical protein